jgi:hypothetical protein
VVGLAEHKGGLVRRFVVVVALTLVALGSAMSRADADAGFLLVDVAGDSRGFTHDPQAPLLVVDHLAPGYDASSVVSVRNTSSSPARLQLSLTDVLDLENGCSEQESRDGLDDCADSRGELSGWLTVTVDREGDAGAGTRLWSGGFRDVVSGADLTDALPAGSTWDLRVTVALPREATNETMTDVVSFGTVLSAASDAGYSEVTPPRPQVGTDTGPGVATAVGRQLAAAASASTASAADVLTPAAAEWQLRATGTSMNRWLLPVAGALLMLACLCLIAVVRRKPRHRA